MKSILFRIILVIMLAIPIYIYRDYFLQLQVMPGREAMRLPGFGKEGDPYLDSLKNKLTRLKLNKIFWENRLKTKIADSYTLVISLYDSAVWMDLNGISIHESYIKSFQISDTLNAKCRSEEIKDWLQKPFHLLEQWASVPKEPIRKKDISNKNSLPDSLDFLPSFADTTDIYIVLVYSNNFKVGFISADLSSQTKPQLKKHTASRTFIENENQPETKNYMDLLQGEWISVEITSLDILSIYRALESDSQLIIGL